MFYPEGCQSNEISFRRVAHTSDTQNQYSVYLYGENSERLPVHALLVFADAEHEFHNTLLFNARQFAKYSTLVRESEFRFNNELALQTRGRRLLLQYDVAPANSSYFQQVEYDAALLLDPHSSMWHEYNVLATERGQLLLRWQDRDSSAVDNSAQDFGGLYRLQCNQSHSRKLCLVQPPRFGVRANANATTGLWVNNVFYANYQLVLDPSQSANLLPYALYMRWRYHDAAPPLQLGFQQGATDLLLSVQFAWQAQPDELDTRLVVGVDALRYFQRTEHRLYSGQFMLYYNSQYQSAAVGSGDSVALRLLWLVLLALLLTCVARWICSSNYQVLHYLLTTPQPRKRAVFDFQYRQMACELTGLVVGVLLWILQMVYTPAITQLNFTYQHSAFQQRKLLLYIFSLYHLGLLGFLLVLSARQLRKMFTHYWARWRFALSVEVWHKDYEWVRRKATKYTTHLATELVIVRNLVLHTVLACDLLFIFNYKTEAKPLYGYFLVLTALALGYFYVKFLFIATYYLYDRVHNQQSPRKVSVNPARWPRNMGALLGFIVASGVVLALFESFSVPVIYLDFLYAINSTYPQTLLIGFTIFFLVVVAATAVVLVAMVVESAVTPDASERRGKT